MDERATLRDLRRTRRRRRLGDIEWFDVAYRVYLLALVGVILTVVVSDAVSGLFADDVTTAQFVDRGPATLGIVAALAVALGLRSGAEGGPVSIEVADVRHVLSAPVDRRTVMALPIAQRLRAVMIPLAVGGAVLGQLVARELDEARGGWAGAGALFGALVGALHVASAVVAHAARLPRWAATGVGIVLVGWQALAAWSVWDDDASSITGPGDRVGSVALWGVRVEPADWIGVAVTVVLVAAGFALGGRLRIEQLMRRGLLVSQLRFAATTQDLRTVVLLRRQLRAERPRSTPWGGRRVRRIEPSPTRPAHPARAMRDTGRVEPAAVWSRGVRSIRRLPAPRLGRIAAYSMAAGVAGSLTVTASPLFGLAVLAAVFLLGMEAIEPLSQEIDRPSLTERLPVDRGWLFSHLLVPPVGVLLVAAVLGVAGVALVEPGHLVAAAAIAVPVVVAGAAGPVVATVRDAPPTDTARHTTVTGRPRGEEHPFAVPEFAGFSMVVATLVPIVVSAVATIPVFAMRAEPSAGTAVRSAIGVALFVLVVVRWIRRRDVWSSRLRAFFAEGRAA